MIRDIGGDPRCFECPLPDCEPTDSRCPLKEAAGGGTLRGPRKTRKHEGIVPASYTDRKDYLRQYRAEYKRRFKRVLVPGLKIRRCDLEVLETACRAKGRTLAEELAAVLEGMAEQARKAMSAGDRKRRGRREK